MKSSILIRVRRSLLVFASFVLVLHLPYSVFAIDEATLDKFAANDIMFYDPEGCQPGAILNNTGTVLPGNDIYEKIWNYYAQNAGLNDYQIAGVLGNTERESGTQLVLHERAIPIPHGLFQMSKDDNTKLWEMLKEYDEQDPTNRVGENSASYYFAEENFFEADFDATFAASKPGLYDDILNIVLEYATNYWRTSISEIKDESGNNIKSMDLYKLPPSQVIGRDLPASELPGYYAELFEVLFEGAYATSSSFYTDTHKLIYIDASKINHAWTGTKFEYYQHASLRRDEANKAMAKYGNGGEMGGYQVPPATQPTTGGSGIRWTEDGWIEPDSLSGYYKEEVYAKDEANGRYHGDSYFGKEFLTNMPNDSTKKGPNKITLHFTEGGNGSANGGPVESVTGIYAKYDENNNQSSSGKQIYASQFTIDLRNKRTYQHGSIYRSGSGVRADDRLAGVQIEIIGFGYANNSTYWDLRDSTQFPDESWDYLATLLLGISEATGIPLTKGSEIDFSEPATSQTGRLTVEVFTSYSGILGHQHSPDEDRPGSPAHTDPGPDVWNNTEAALRRSGVDTTGGGRVSYGACGAVSTTSEGDVNALQEAVLQYSHHDYQSGREDPVPAYADLMRERAANGFYTGGAGANNGIPGIDCGAWVSTMMVVSGWDPDYNYGTEIGRGAGNTEYQLKYLQESPIWEDITSGASDGTIKLKAGDVIIYHNGGVHGHTLFVAFDENDNESHGYTSEATSASYQTRAPGADATRINNLVNTWVNASYNAKIFRKK